MSADIPQREVFARIIDPKPWEAAYAEGDQWRRKQASLAKADQIIEALAALPQSTERGWKLVPVEPSDAMIEMGYEALREGQEWGRMQCAPDIYTAMIQASPEPPVGMGGGDNFSVARVDVTPPSGASDGQRKSEGGAS